MQQLFDAVFVRRLRGLLRLTESAIEAKAAGADRWQYAVPSEFLRHHAGLTNADIQAIVNEGHALHRVETTGPRQKKRSFRKSDGLDSTSRACFVLSAEGERLARKLCALAAQPAGDGLAKPTWDPATGDWTIGGVLIKHLPERAAAQRAVLDQCERQEWAGTIDSPFANLPPKRRSHYLGQVLHHLNSGQRDAHVHLGAIDKGRQIRWNGAS